MFKPCVYLLFISFLSFPLKAEKRHCLSSFIKILHKSSAILTLGQFAPPPILRGIPSRGLIWARRGLLKRWSNWGVGKSRFGLLDDAIYTGGHFSITITPIPGPRQIRFSQAKVDQLRAISPKVDISIKTPGSDFSIIDIQVFKTDFEDQKTFEQVVQEVYAFLMKKKK